MRDEQKEPAQEEVFLPKLPGQRYGGWGKKGPGNRKVMAAILAAALVLVSVIGIGGRINGRTTAVLQASAVKSAEVKKGSISTTVSGTGTLAADDTEDVELLSLVSVDTVYVEAGDQVVKGQRLALVDPLSVRQALTEIQAKLDQVDEELEEAQDDKVDSVIESNVSGRVKKIFGKKGDTVSAVMQEQGALMLLSLDGKMAVTVETDREVSVGDRVQVTLAGQEKEIEGTVTVLGDRTVTVTLTDDGTEYGAEAQVYDGDTWLGTGTLRINSELKVTGYAGVIEAVKASENQKVKDGTDLYKLTDLPHTAEYERLVAERAELADTLQELIGLYADGTIYAGKDGTIQSVNCDGAKTVKDDYSAVLQSAGADRENESGGASAGEDSEKNGTVQGERMDADGVAEPSGAASNGGSSTGFAGTDAAANPGGVKTMGYPGGSMANGRRTAFTYTQADNNTGEKISGTFGSEKAQISGQTGDDTGNGGSSGQTDQGAGSTGSGTDVQKPDGAGQDTGDGTDTGKPDDSSDTGNTGGTGSGDGPSADPGQTDGSSSGNDTDSAAGEDGMERLAITSLSAITIADPAAGESVQRELILAGGGAYEGTLAWSPKADKTYEENTAYTATVELKAREGYYFDSDHMQAGKTAVSNGSGGKTVLTEIKEVKQDGTGMTFAIVYPKTGNETKTPGDNPSGTNGGGQTEQPSAAGFSWTGGTGTVSAGAYGSKTTSGTGTDASDDAAGETDTGDTTRTVIFTQSADEKMAVTVSVDERDILSLREGQTAQVTLDAIENETFEGTVTEIRTLSDTSGNGVTKYSAIVELAKTGQMLTGMNASVTVTVSESSDCLVIPEEALHEYGNRVTVYTAYDESTGELSGETEVSTGVSNGTQVEITEGVSEGDTVYYHVTADDMSGMDTPFMMTAPGDAPGDAGGGRRGEQGGGRPDKGTGGPGEAR